MIETARRISRSSGTEVSQQFAAVVMALDKLFEAEVPRGASRPVLRLVSPIDDDVFGAGALASEGLRAFLVRRGCDIWTCGGEIELFNAMRHVMAARPRRQRWNRFVLSTLWADIGLHEREIA
jgi:hypothetical protein